MTAHVGKWAINSIFQVENSSLQQAVPSFFYYGKVGYLLNANAIATHWISGQELNLGIKRSEQPPGKRKVNFVLALIASYCWMAFKKVLSWEFAENRQCLDSSFLFKISTAIHRTTLLGESSSLFRTLFWASLPISISWSNVDSEYNFKQRFLVG